MTLPSQLRRDFLSSKFPRALVAGWILATIIVLYCFAVSAIIFRGPLLPFAAEGAGMLLFGAAVFCLLVGLSSGYRGALAVPQDISAAVLGTMATTVAAGTAYAPAQTTFMTMTALLIISSLITGLVLAAIGHFRLSNLFRFIPYSVTGGFFAGTGWTVSLAALALMNGVPLDWETLPLFLDSGNLWKWAPGVVYGLILALVMKRRNSIAILFVSLVAVTAAFHLILFLLDLSVEDAEAAGLVLSGIPEGGLWPVFGLSDFVHVDWGVVAGQFPGVLAVATVTLLCLLVYVNGLEVATGVKVDVDREFRATGFAGMVAGAGGSPPGAHSIVLCLASRMMGADTPWTGIVTSLALCLTMFFGSTILELLPTSVIGGLLFFLGVELLNNWLFAIRKRLHWTDYGIVLLIALTIAVVGFVEGIAVGLFAALTLFAIRLSRMEVIEASLTGRGLRSRKVRSVPDRAILLDRGDRIRIFRLRGYVFFGSVYRLVDRLEEPLSNAPVPSFIVLDCTGVLGFDFSSISVLCEFLRTAYSSGVRLVLCAPPDRFRSEVVHNLPVAVVDGLVFETDLDRALERCEDMNIAAFQSELAASPGNARGELLERVAHDLEEHLDRQILFEELVARLEPWLERLRYDIGDTLAGPGRTQKGMQFLVTGRVSVHDAEGKRLFQCGPGDAIAPQAAFGIHRAVTAALAEEPCVTMMLTPLERQMLETADPELGMKLYRFLMTNGPSAGRA